MRGLLVMPPLNAFEEGLGLDLPSLRALLARGDARDRVWAAWALGMKIGGDFAREATMRTRREPDPGVRRHLIVVMAGLGEAAALQVIAESDPDPYVRATAYRYLFQIFGSDAIARVLSAATSDPSDVVREEAVRILEGKWPAARRGDLVSLLRDVALGVRQAAADRLAEGPLAAGELAAIVPIMLGESDGALRRRLVTILVERGASEDIPPLLQGLPVERLTDVLDLLHKAGVQTTWAQLAVVASRNAPAVDRRVLQVLRAAEEADLIWLARCAARTISWSPTQNRAEDRDVEIAGGLARTALLAKVAVIEPYPLAGDERALFVALIEELKIEETALRDESQEADAYGEWDPAWVEDLVAHRRRLERFVGESTGL